jgi:high-affinity iron transporter
VPPFLRGPLNRSTLSGNVRREERSVYRWIWLGVVLMIPVTTACTDRAARGRDLYAKHGCAVCHGRGGRGDGPAARTLNPPPRDLTDARHYKEGSSENAIAASIRQGVTGSATMPAFTNLSQEDAQAIAAWIVSLQARGIK